MNKKYIIITSIFPPTLSIEKFSRIPGWNVVVVGDKKTDQNWSFPNVKFISVTDQEKMDSTFVGMLPWNSYTRKNIGYQYAISKGAEIIYDTDDDNIPLENWNQNPIFQAEVEVITQPKFVNIYSFFTDEHVWPRGLPLQYILRDKLKLSLKKKPVRIGVWQFLADEDPDVDAIYRLTNISQFILIKENLLLWIPGLVVLLILKTLILEVKFFRYFIYHQQYHFDSLIY